MKTTTDRARDFLRNVFPDFGGVEDKYVPMVTKLLDDAVTDEVERCALLVTMRANIARASGKRIRDKGTFTTRAIWPPFKKVVCVMPKWEQAARDMEAVARAFDEVAECIREGYDPRDLEPERSDPIPPPLPEDKYQPGDEVGGYGIVHPGPITDAERLDALRKANSLFREPIRPGD